MTSEVKWHPEYFSQETSDKNHLNLILKQIYVQGKQNIQGIKQAEKLKSCSSKRWNGCWWGWWLWWCAWCCVVMCDDVVWDGVWNVLFDGVSGVEGSGKVKWMILSC